MNIRNEPEFRKVLLNAKRAAYAKAVKEGKSAAFLISLQKMIIASAK